MQLGQMIKSRRVSLKLTQVELARQAGISQGSLSLIESGDTRSLSGPTLVGPSTSLGIEPKVLASACAGRTPDELPIENTEAVVEIMHTLTPQSQSLLRAIAESILEHERLLSGGPALKKALAGRKSAA